MFLYIWYILYISYIRRLNIVSMHSLYSFEFEGPRGAGSRPSRTPLRTPVTNTGSKRARNGAARVARRGRGVRECVRNGVRRDCDTHIDGNFTFD